MVITAVPRTTKATLNTPRDRASHVVRKGLLGDTGLSAGEMDTRTNILQGEWHPAKVGYFKRTVSLL